VTLGIIWFEGSVRTEAATWRDSCDGRSRSEDVTTAPAVAPTPAATIMMRNKPVAGAATPQTGWKLALGANLISAREHVCRVGNPPHRETFLRNYAAIWLRVATAVPSRAAAITREINAALERQAQTTPRPIYFRATGCRH